MKKFLQNITKEIVLFFMILSFFGVFIYQIFIPKIRLEFIMDYFYFGLFFGFFIIILIYLAMFIYKHQIKK